MTYSVTFDTDAIFAPRVRKAVDAWLQGEMRAGEVAQMLGWSPELFSCHVAGIFNLALRGYSRMARLEMLDSNAMLAERPVAL